MKGEIQRIFFSLENLYRYLELRTFFPKLERASPTVELVGLHPFVFNGQLFFQITFLDDNFNGKDIVVKLICIISVDPKDMQKIILSVYDKLRSFGLVVLDFW